MPAQSLQLNGPRSIDLLFLGRPTRVKGFDLFIDLVARLPPDLRIAVAGVSLQSWMALVPHQVSRRVWCLGEIASVERFVLLAKARIVVVPSRYESFGMVAAEAMASGCQVLAWATGGTFEAYPGELVHFVAPFDGEAMAQAAMARLETPNLDTARVDAFLAASNAAYVQGVKQILLGRYGQRTSPPRAFSWFQPASRSPAPGWQAKLRKLRGSPTQFFKDFVAKHFT